MFRSATEDNTDLYADSVSEFLSNCIGDVVPTVTIETYPNQKLWVDGDIRIKLKVGSNQFNHGKRSGDMAEQKQCSNSLRRAIKQAKCRYSDKVESQFNGSGMRRMWQGLQEITDHKNSHVTDINVTLPGKLNTIFEDNTVPPSQTFHKDCGPHPSFSMANMSKTFTLVNPRKAAGPDGIHSHVLRTCTDQLTVVFTDIFSCSLSQSVAPTCFKMATIVPRPKKAKVTELNDYRPIALTSVTIKCFERLVKDHITATPGPQMMQSPSHCTLPYPVWTKRIPM
jgi:hypothetical protein